MRCKRPSGYYTLLRCGSMLDEKISVTCSARCFDSKALNL